MAKRENHYEAAFEAYLRARLIPYVAVDESRRALYADGSLKSLDFIVSCPRAGNPSNTKAAHAQVGNWLVDVKGRRFPSGLQKQYWKNWSTWDDMRSLSRWQALFGGNFQGMLVFAFWIVGSRAPLPAEKLFAFRDQLYAFMGVSLADYVAHCRLISPKWDTVAVSARGFRKLSRPLEEFFGEDFGEDFGEKFGDARLAQTRTAAGPAGPAGARVAPSVH
jgi:hypothetical protein